MSINILLNEQGTEPIRSEDEYFILKRNDISYRITLESKTQYEGEGYMILTSNRLVIFPMKQNTSFRSIEIPLNQIYSEEFKQPLFGKNYIKGNCRPFFQGQLGNFNFIIWLKGNRVGTLVGAFFTLIDSLRNNQGRNHNFNIIKCLKDNNFNAIFAIDPEDNSFIYQIQPSSINIPKQNFQSVIINRPNNFNNRIQNLNRPNNFNNRKPNQNNNYGNFSRLNEEEIKKNNDVYMSHFIYRNPNDKFVYKDPGFEYKEPNNINNNINNINNRINNNSNNINNNIYYINNNINNNINNRIRSEDDEDDLINPYDIKNNNDQNNINNNINRSINNINNNMFYSNNPPRIIMNSPPIIQSQYLHRNIQAINNNDDIDFNNPYKIKNNNNNSANNIINQPNPHNNQRYPLQNNPINQNNNYFNNPNIQNNQNVQINNKYNQIHYNNKIIQTNNNKIIDNNRNIGKYRQLNEEIPDENELNSKNQLNNNEFNESNINFDNKQDLSLISHKTDSLPDLSNIYPDI